MLRKRSCGRGSATLCELLDAASGIFSNVSLSSIEGLFVFGSVARGEDRPNSDLDLFVVFESAAHTYIWNLPNKRVDVFSMSIGVLEARCRDEMGLNNSFVLDALADCIPLITSSERLADLITAARRRRKSGPPARDVAWFRAARRDLRLMLRGLPNTRIGDGITEQHSLYLKHMRQDQIARRAVRSVFIARRQFTTSFPRLIQKLALFDHDLFGLWLSYVSASANGGDAEAELRQITSYAAIAIGREERLVRRSLVNLKY